VPQASAKLQASACRRTEPEPIVPWLAATPGMSQSWRT
jgi:hypothetical protein